MYVLLVPAAVSKNNLHASCLSMHVYAKIFNYFYFDDITNLFLHAAALLLKHRTKDKDTQSIIHIY